VPIIKALDRAGFGLLEASKPGHFFRKVTRQSGRQVPIYQLDGWGKYSLRAAVKAWTWLVRKSTALRRSFDQARQQSVSSVSGFSGLS